jgi:hypothetical protein
MVGLEILNLHGLLLRPPDKIIDHIGQLVYLYVLEVNTLIRLIHDAPYTIHGIPDEVGLFLQPVHRVVLETTHVPQLRFEAMDFGQQLSPDGSGILGVSLAPHLALSLFRFKQPPFQQPGQRATKRSTYYLNRDNGESVTCQTQRCSPTGTKLLSPAHEPGRRTTGLGTRPLVH